MPYRNAHWWLLSIFPMIAVAFWPTYYSQIRAVPFGLHAHGTTASLWLILLTVQSATIRYRRWDWHKLAGRATFVALPLFAAAGPLALQGIIKLFLARSDPFHAAYGARLAMTDMVAGPSVVALVVYALVNRRRVWSHASAMLATALLMLPPVLGRLLLVLPGFPKHGLGGLTGFELAFQIAESVPVLLAAYLATRHRAARFAFAFVTVATLAQMIGFATFARTAWWERLVGLVAQIPTLPLASAAGLFTLGLLLWAWRRLPGQAMTGAVAAGL